MKMIAVLLLLVLGSGAAPPDDTPDTPAAELTRALDRFYTWGDVVGRFKCRVHGRWLDHGGGTARQGQFWGDVEYRDGTITYRAVRSLGRERDPDEIRADLIGLIEQAGLLPTGMPLPEGRVSRKAIPGAKKTAHYTVNGAGSPDVPPYLFRVESGRITGVTVPAGRGRGSILFRLKSTWITGDRYLVTGLTGNRGAKKDRPRVAYHYSCFAGNFFPRAITEERGTTRLSLIFYWYDIELEP